MTIRELTDLEQIAHDELKDRFSLFLDLFTIIFEESEHKYSKRAVHEAIEAVLSAKSGFLTFDYTLVTKQEAHHVLRCFTNNLISEVIKEAMGKSFTNPNCDVFLRWRELYEKQFIIKENDGQ